MNDPWAVVDANGAPLRITAQQIHRIVGIIAGYSATEADALIADLASRRTTGPCGACGYIAGNHARTCPTQGDRP